MAVMQEILSAQGNARKLLVVLIDPDKPVAIEALSPHLCLPDLIFVGGSTGSQTDICVAQLRQYTNRPILLFPGNIAQFTPTADALLFLTLLNAQTPDVLINPHIQVAQEVLRSGIETIPMGYILVDGDRQSAVERVSGCTPIARQAVTDVVSHAVAGQLLGKQLIYIEAGSGAKTPVSIDTVRAVRQAIDVPLIVGGGITTEQQMLLVFSAGANIVVVGNHFEQHSEDLPRFLQAKQSYVHTN
jgi:putative glycerol-1-phosphate prenyltransferase